MAGFAVISGNRRSAGRCYIYLYLPTLPIRRMGRQLGWDSTRPAGIYQTENNIEKVTFLCDLARAQGLCPGMSVADARARQPDIQLALSDRNADRAVLSALARWAWRYSPRTGTDNSGPGLWIDMTGASHLYGGTDKVIDDIKKRCHLAELPVWIAAAPYYAAARALACHDRAAAQGLVALSGRRALLSRLCELPVTALTTDNDTLQALSQAGLRRIVHFLPLSQAELAVRYGPDFVRGWAVLRGDHDESPAPVTALQPVRATRSWPEPVAGYETLAAMIAEMTDELAATLTRRELAARSFELGWQRTDSTTGRLYFHLSRPGADKKILHRLFCEAAGQIDAEFGIDYSWIQAYRLSVDRPVTALLGTESEALSSSQTDHMLDILAIKLGPEKVRRVYPRAFWHIADSTVSQPLGSADASCHNWLDDGGAAFSAPRPIRLLAPPEAVHVVALMPDHPPAMLVWRRRSLKIVRATGPERVGPRWWDPAHAHMKTRDYYRIETESGQRLWIYRSGLAEREERCEWFVEGYFA